MMFLFAYIVWICYSIIEGKREAQYYSFKMRSTLSNNKAIVKDEHAMFAIQRLLVLSLCFFMFFEEWLISLLFVFSMMLCFPFLHDGMYYLTRKKMDGIYKKGWFDQSTTSTALSDKLHLFDPIPRTVLFGISIIINLYLILS